MERLDASWSCFIESTLVQDDRHEEASPVRAAPFRIRPRSRPPRPALPPVGSGSAEERVGERLRARRVVKGWSQAELATRMSGRDEKWTQSTIAKTEGATRPIRLNELAALAETLDVPLADLIEPEREVPLERRAELQALVIEDATLRARRAEVRRQWDHLDTELNDLEERLDRVGGAYADALESIRIADN